MQAATKLKSKFQIQPGGGTAKKVSKVKRWQV